MIPQVEDAAEKLWALFEEKKPAIDELLKKEKIDSEEVKQACLHAYRYQIPDIHLYEGVAKMMSNLIKKAFKTNCSTKIGYLFAKKGFDDLSAKLKSDKIGGAMLLGVNGVVVKSHGGSSEGAFTSAMEVLYSIVKENALELIKNGVNENA